ncbi:MAG: FIST N-terminal domain-containing protein [Polyangia bacterium]
MGRVCLRTAYSQSLDPERVAAELTAALAPERPALALLFAARDRDHLALNQAVRRRLPAGTRLIGATTEGELDSAGMHEGGVVLGAISGDIEFGLGLGRGLSRDAIAAGATAAQRACQDLGVEPDELDPKQYGAIVIDDGTRFKKEELLIGALSRSPSLVLVGGGAAPALQADALVHVDGEVVTDAVLIALFRTSAPWAALRSHWYVPTGEKLRITRVDDSHTRALEIDGKPAAARYAEILGVTVDELEFGKPRGFASRPTGLRVGREYFLRSPWKPLPDGSILFANLLEEGAVLELLRSESFIGPTGRFFREELPRRVRSPSACVLFHCGGRAWLARSAGFMGALSEELRSGPPSIGLNCHFEIYCGFHINTTLTALAFGSDT